MIILKTELWYYELHITCCIFWSMLKQLVCQLGDPPQKLITYFGKCQIWTTISRIFFFKLRCFLFGYYYYTRNNYHMLLLLIQIMWYTYFKRLATFVVTHKTQKPRNFDSKFVKLLKYLEIRHTTSINYYLLVLIKLYKALCHTPEIDIEHT